VTHLAAGLCTIDTAALTDLSPFITMDLNAITVRVARGGEGEEAVEKPTGRPCMALVRGRDAGKGLTSEKRRGGMNEPLRILEISDYL
jgi:hypothetical protein